MNFSLAFRLFSDSVLDCEIAQFTPKLRCQNLLGLQTRVGAFVRF